MESNIQNIGRRCCNDAAEEQPNARMYVCVDINVFSHRHIVYWCMCASVTVSRAALYISSIFCNTHAMPIPHRHVLVPVKAR